MRYTTYAVMVLALLISGCSGLRQIEEAGDAVGDIVREGQDVVQETGETIEEVGEAAEATKEAGQRIRELKKKEFNLVLQRESRDSANVPVRVRPVGSGLDTRTLSPGEYVTYRMPVSRYVEEANFSIYTEINGRGRPIKVEKGWRGEVQSGSTEILVLIKRGPDDYIWIPPNVEDGDRRIDYGV